MTSKYPRLAIVEIYNPKTKKTDKQYILSDPDEYPDAIKEIDKKTFNKLLNEKRKEYNNECSIK